MLGKPGTGSSNALALAACASVFLILPSSPSSAAEPDSDRWYFCETTAQSGRSAGRTIVTSVFRAEAQDETRISRQWTSYVLVFRGADDACRSFESEETAENRLEERVQQINDSGGTAGRVRRWRPFL